MSNDSKLITIYISQNKADILTKIPIIEAKFLELPIPQG